MLFNSIFFLFFFSAVYVIYWLLPEKKRKDFLLLAGIVFYSFFSVGFTIHFLAIVGLNYFLYRKIRMNPGSGLFVRLAVILNTINLGFFKYFYFFNRVLADITSYPFFRELPSAIDIALPMAISFYSFQMIAAAVDTYRDPSSEEIQIRDYFLFVVFFPVLIAGPIMRIHDFFPNLKSLKPDKEKTYRACYLMMSGLIKKVLIADPAAMIVSPVFNDPASYGRLDLFLAGIGYSIQVFCDFSGLTDMARSTALFLGFEIPENFKAPFFSTSGRELWRRWHITLSFWLREYIYIPLGGSRVSEWRGYFNLILTMTIGGFWHGADYTFILWGFYWGVILAAERMLEVKFKLPLTPEKSTILKILKAGFVFLLFSISALMFRSNSAESMVILFKGLVQNDYERVLSKMESAKELNWISDSISLYTGEEIFYLQQIEELEKLGYLFLALIGFHWIQYFPEKLERFRKWDSIIVFVLGFFTIFLLALMSQTGGEFIYYKF